MTGLFRSRSVWKPNLELLLRSDGKEGGRGAVVVVFGRDPVGGPDRGRQPQLVQQPTEISRVEPAHLVAELNQVHRRADRAPAIRDGLRDAIAVDFQFGGI